MEEDRTKARLKSNCIGIWRKSKGVPGLQHVKRVLMEYVTAIIWG